MRDHEGLIQQTCGNARCDDAGTSIHDTNMGIHNMSTHPAAVSSPNDSSEDHQLDDPSQALMAKATKTEMWVISIGAQDQEMSQLWNERAKTGTLKAQQKYCTNAIQKHGKEHGVRTTTLLVTRSSEPLIGITMPATTRLSTDFGRERTHTM